MGGGEGKSNWGVRRQLSGEKDVYKGGIEMGEDEACSKHFKESSCARV